MVNILSMEEEKHSQSNSPNKLIAGGVGAIFGAIAAKFSIDGINDFYEKNASELLEKASLIKKELISNSTDELKESLSVATKAWTDAKTGLNKSEAIAIATAIFVGVTVLSSLAINTLMPDKKIDPATVEKQKIETVEQPLPNEKVANL